MPQPKLPAPSAELPAAGADGRSNMKKLIILAFSLVLVTAAQAESIAVVEEENGLPLAEIMAQIDEFKSMHPIYSERPVAGCAALKTTILCSAYGEKKHTFWIAETPLARTPPFKHKGASTQELILVNCRRHRLLSLESTVYSEPSLQGEAIPLGRGHWFSPRDPQLLDLMDEVCLMQDE